MDAEISLRLLSSLQTLWGQAVKFGFYSWKLMVESAHGIADLICTKQSAKVQDQLLHTFWKLNEIRLYACEKHLAKVQEEELQELDRIVKDLLVKKISLIQRSKLNHLNLQDLLKDLLKSKVIDPIALLGISYGLFRFETESSVADIIDLLSDLTRVKQDSNFSKTLTMKFISEQLLFLSRLPDATLNSQLGKSSIEMHLVEFVDRLITTAIESKSSKNKTVRDIVRSVIQLWTKYCLKIDLFNQLCDSCFKFIIDLCTSGHANDLIQPFCSMILKHKSSVRTAGVQRFFQLLTLCKSASVEVLCTLLKEEPIVTHLDNKDASNNFLSFKPMVLKYFNGADEEVGSRLAHYYSVTGISDSSWELVEELFTSELIENVFQHGGHRTQRYWSILAALAKFSHLRASIIKCTTFLEKSMHLFLLEGSPEFLPFFDNVFAGFDIEHPEIRKILNLMFMDESDFLFAVCWARAAAAYGKLFQWPFLYTIEFRSTVYNNHRALNILFDNPSKYNVCELMRILLKDRTSFVYACGTSFFEMYITQITKQCIEEIWSLSPKAKRCDMCELKLCNVRAEVCKWASLSQIQENLLGLPKYPETWFVFSFFAYSQESLAWAWRGIMKFYFDLAHEVRIRYSYSLAFLAMQIYDKLQVSSISEISPITLLDEISVSSDTITVKTSNSSWIIAKSIMMKYSDMFQAMLSSDFKESTKGSTINLDVQDEYSLDVMFRLWDGRISSNMGSLIIYMESKSEQEGSVLLQLLRLHTIADRFLVDNICQLVERIVLEKYFHMDLEALNYLVPLLSGFSEITKGQPFHEALGILAWQSIIILPNYMEELSTEVMRDLLEFVSSQL